MTYQFNPKKLPSDQQTTRADVLVDQVMKHLEILNYWLKEGQMESPDHWEDLTRKLAEEAIKCKDYYENKRNKDHTVPCLIPPIHNEAHLRWRTQYHNEKPFYYLWCDCFCIAEISFVNHTWQTLFITRIENHEDMDTQWSFGENNFAHAVQKTRKYVIEHIREMFGDNIHISYDDDSLPQS